MSGESEVVAVEVRTDLDSYASSLGQAYGYSLRAHRCYLAVPTTFEPYHKYLANRLGVGLLSIRRNSKIELELTSGRHDPHAGLMSDFLYRLNVGRCTFCGAFLTGAENYVDSNSKKLHESVLKSKGLIGLETSFEDHREIIFPYRKAEYKLSFLCPSCYRQLKAMHKSPE